MAACSSLRSVFEYETNKVVRIYSVWYGSLKWIIHFTVFLYVSIVLVADRRYQKKDSVISSVHVKVKGVSQTDKRVWDTAEYTIPGQFPLAKAVCTTDKSCAKGRVDPQGNAYGIRFDILIFGTAGKFDFFEMVVYIGSALSYFGLTLFYVTFVDEPGILMIDESSDFSLQSTKGRIIEKSQGDFMQSSRLPYRDWTISPQNPEELQLLQNRREGPCFRERPSWCGCGKCRPADPFWEQLCCRKTEGACITTSSLFQQLVLSRSVLEFVLLHKDPLLDLSAAGQNPFRHCAYEQYIRWRFGEGDLGDRAVIPNCCRWRIRDAFPSENGEYSGFVKKK
ncbi:putative p2X purinoceptor protein [Naja naja]|nr:putative p2X purinoceptor protein [Naja naja]